MKITSSLKNTLTSLYHSLQRFPISIAFSTSMVAVLIAISEIRFKQGYNHTNIEKLSRVTMVLFLGFLLSLCVKLLFERYTNVSGRIKCITYIVAAIVLVLYYLFLLQNLEMIPISRFIALSFSLLLCFIFIPYLGRRENIELYTIRIFTRFFITMIYSIILFLGLSAIIFTSNKLLNIPIYRDLYYYTWLITVGIFAPIFFLAGVPHDNENLKDYGYPKFFKILLLYIVIPLIIVYLGILYIYFAKIIITRVWPIGLVSHLVLWYAAICVGVIFLISPIKNNTCVDKFTFFFPKFILPILLMMFASMGIRTQAYGITENRYYVITLGLWILCVMIYISLKKIRRNMVLPASLAVVTIVCVFGPLSSFNVSKWSQNRRLTHILRRNEMIAQDRIMPKSDTSEEDKTQINSILSYFNNTHHLRDIKYLDDNFVLTDMKDVFGFSYKHRDPYDTLEQYFSYHIGKNFSSIEIANYSHMFDFRMIPGSTAQDNLSVKYSESDGTVKVFLDENEIYNLDLSILAETLQKKYPKQNTVMQDDMIYTDENEFVQVKFVFSHIRGFRATLDDTLKVNGGEFLLFLNLK